MIPARRVVNFSLEVISWGRDLSFVALLCEFCTISNDLNCF